VSPARYKPRLSLLPIVPVRWRSPSPKPDETIRRSWRLFLFGVVPVATVPRGVVAPILAKLFPVCPACGDKPVMCRNCLEGSVI